MANSNLELITIGGGCFWCIEAVFNEIKGVKKVVSGYTGGKVPGRPTVIYYHNDEQRIIAETVVKEMTPYYSDPIVTEISASETFYEAEENHQNYYKNNSSQGYCTAVITPKLVRLRKMHADKLKEQVS